MPNLSDLMDEHEAELLKHARAAIAAEDAAWAALSPEEQAARIEARAAKWEALDPGPLDDEDDDEEDEDDAT